jgi:hypothetical protein
VDARHGFSTLQAYGHVKEICYPRRVGTVGERRAARVIRRHFDTLGLDPQCERFCVSLFPALIGDTLLFAGCFLLVLGAAGIFNRWPLAAALAWGAAALFVNAPWRMPRSLGSRWPPYRHTQNIVATLRPRPRPCPARVVFMAHYDTKSQWWPTGVRVAFVMMVTALCAGLGGMGLLAALGTVTPASMAWTASIAAAVFLGGLALNRTGNRSPGALDNGSSIGTLLELARSWRPVEDAPVEVLWVATAAEEVGLCGARHFLSRRLAWWQDKPTLLINLESVGVGTQVYLAGEANALRLAEATADTLGFRHARLRVLGAGMDHEPFAACKLSAVSILGDVVSASLAMHSPRDDMSIIQEAALERAGRLAAHLAWRWAQFHQPST